jgi:prepilin-type processing-associated H-X9-DG protein
MNTASHTGKSPRIGWVAVVGPLLLALAFAVWTGVLHGRRHGTEIGLAGAVVIVPTWLGCSLVVMLLRHLGTGGVSRNVADAIVATYRGGIWILAVGFLLLYPAMTPSFRMGDHIWRPMCATQLANIGRAMKSYHDLNGHFPPAYTTDKNGMPLMSWRVLLMPFLNGEQDFKRLRLDEPWNSEHNYPILKNSRLSSVFHCSTNCQEQSDEELKRMSYMMLVGPDAVSTGRKSVALEEVVDPAETFLVVEVATSGAFWAEPRDLDTTDMDWHINGTDRRGISSLHTGGANVLYCDGHVEFLTNDTPVNRIRAASLAAGPSKKRER